MPTPTFETFWEAYMKAKPGIYYKLKAKAIWYTLSPKWQELAIECVEKGHPVLWLLKEPWEYLEYFSIPFD